MLTDAIQSLTVLTGAGASLFAGAPSTSDLTAAVATRELSGTILRTLVAKQGDARGFNFEDVLHVLEELELLADPHSRSRATQSIKPFLDRNSVLQQFGSDWLTLRRERLDVLQLLRAQFENVQYHETQPLFRLLRPFVDRFDLHWFTLNYDVLSDVAMEQLSRSADKKWYNGFGGILGQFRPDEYARAVEKFGPIHLWLAHLHGSLRFAYAVGDSRLAHGLPLELVLAGSVETAAENWSEFHSLALGPNSIELGGVSPLISGLRKSDKLYVRPYGNYLHRFVQSLISSPFLLIIGYGGEDPHISYWLRQFIDIHLAKGRVIEVTMTDDPQKSVVGTLGQYNLVWKEVAPKVYANHAGVRALVIASGLTNDSRPPTQLMFEHLAGALTKP